MKQVIIALTTAAVVCAASASFAQVSNTNPIKTDRVAIKIVAVGATSSAMGLGKSHVVMVNGKRVNFQAGTNEKIESLALSKSEMPILTVDGTACHFDRSSATALKQGGRLDALTLSVTSSKPNATAPGATKTIHGTKPLQCEVVATVSGKQRRM